MIRGKQIVSAKEGECWIDENGEYKPLPNLYNIKWEIDLGNSALDVLGSSLKVHRNFGGEITGSAEIYDNSDAFTAQLYDFIKNGRSVYFSMKLVSEDPTADVGKRIYTFTDCLVSNSTLFNIDASSNELKKTLSLTADGLIVGNEYNPMED
ncbi:phage tail tube protein [Candidatus Methanomassiliicoccus intestinalis]|jgi:hypothetical protein|uniref:phage tail tube protein n=1 Tax=Candidatus Methanomassiliicoccus intestinalis TaxID=1406512 RepID=UPI00204E51C3|nr:MAG TPA: tail tube protein [Caudoviricetes sp.]